MKKFLSLLFILLSIQSFAQTNFRFADSTAQWSELGFNDNYPNHTFTNVWNVVGDTVINGKNYQGIGVGNHFSLFLREDSLKQVFSFRNISEPDYKIYDFGKNVGDTTTIGDLHSDLNFYHFIIDSIKSSFNGIQRRAFYVTPIEYPWSHDVWIEGIGCLYTELWSPSATWEAVDGPGWNLLCYFENGQRVYHNDSYPDTCLINSPLEVEDVNRNAIKLFPNPATDYITIQSQTNLHAQTIFLLFDLTGRMVLQKQLTGATNRIELNELSKGMYLYNITSRGQKISSGKLAVQ